MLTMMMTMMMLLTMMLTMMMMTAPRARNATGPALSLPLNYRLHRRGASPPVLLLILVIIMSTFSLKIINTIHQPVLKNRGRYNKLKLEVRFTGLSLLGIPNKQGVLGVQGVLVNRYLIIRNTTAWC